jgi:hypothetical protein
MSPQALSLRGLLLSVYIFTEAVDISLNTWADGPTGLVQEGSLIVPPFPKVNRA